ncbi:hypothetical protein H6G76_02820 [Nostoc sp. FACHB-152]|nr:hypothetical protein [Nostoc sp. FACHB-152]MBD2467337.1 hypothetical protein [Nostoc sp. FACHB-145]
MSLIEKLTPEQEALIPVYREKWRKTALSTERIDREKAAEAVKAVYQFMGFDEPEIVFFDSPYAALQEFSLKLVKPISNINAYRIENKIFSPLSNHIEFKLQSKELVNFIKKEIIYKLIDSRLPIYAPSILQLDLNIFSLNYILPELLIAEVRFIDFGISELNCDCFQQNWVILQNLIKNCGWIFPDENIAILCDRPIHLRFDNENRLHAEGEPAIQFADGYSIYSYHGVNLPEKYGKIHPQQWEAQWLLTETNAELRRVLIQGIGYSRICQDLQAIELDNWAEYTLLRIDSDIDIEPIYLLKMTCPSTGFIHVLCVPPNMVSAREAIRWVNGETDPEDFIIET